MSKNNIELRKCRLSGATLTHWDSIHGNDVIIQIYPDGTATVRDENNIEQPCDLASELIKLACNICE